MASNRPNWYYDHPPACTCQDCATKKAVSNQYGKIGRNEKCPCGSKKKYKKCCGA